MKLFLIAATLLSSTLAFAAVETKITSFNYVVSNTPTTAAELCGVVKGGTGNEVVQINVDPNSKTPGRYTTLLASDGSFCVVVSTLTGQASAGVRGQTQLANASIQ